MARIRTIKPEAFTSESLAQVSVEAERSFFGLLTQADDRGRHRDNSAVIAGQLWPLRPEHTAVHVEIDLQQLHRAGLLCRYVGCDGKRYLHVPTWDRHQKINKPSESRLPVCRGHDPKAVCGLCGTVDCASKLTPPPDDSGSIPGGLREGSNHSETDIRNGSGIGLAAQNQAASTTIAMANGYAESAQETPGHRLGTESSRNAPVALQEGSSPGSRIYDLGSSVLSEPGDFAPAAPTETVTAQHLVADWLDHVGKRPPGKVIGQVAKQLKEMLDEGIDPVDIRRGVASWARKGLHPSTLPSEVNAAMNASGNVVAIRNGQTLAATGTDNTVAGWAAVSQQLAQQEPK